MSGGSLASGVDGGCQSCGEQLRAGGAGVDVTGLSGAVGGVFQQQAGGAAVAAGRRRSVGERGESVGDLAAESGGHGGGDGVERGDRNGDAGVGVVGRVVGHRDQLAVVDGADPGQDRGQVLLVGAQGGGQFRLRVLAAAERADDGAIEGADARFSSPATRTTVIVAVGASTARASESGVIAIAHLCRLHLGVPEYPRGPRVMRPLHPLFLGERWVGTRTHTGSLPAAHRHVSKWGVCVHPCDINGSVIAPQPPVRQILS